MKKAVNNIKEENLENKISKLKEDFQKHSSRNFFRAVRKLEGRPMRFLTIVKGKKGMT